MKSLYEFIYEFYISRSTNPGKVVVILQVETPLCTYDIRKSKNYYFKIIKKSIMTTQKQEQEIVGQNFLHE